MNIILVNYRLYTIVNVVELLLYKYSVMTCRLTSVHIEVYLSVVQYNEGGGGGVIDGFVVFLTLLRLPIVFAHVGNSLNLDEN